MKDWLNSVLARIADGTLLPAAYFRELDCDAVGEARDGDPRFEKNWMKLFSEMEKRWDTTDVDDEIADLVDELREVSFLAAGSATGYHDIASNVSDDLDLVARSRLVGLSDPFLDDLWAAYDRGEYPLPR